MNIISKLAIFAVFFGMGCPLVGQTRAQLPRPPAVPEGYKTPEEVEAILKGLVSQYPQLAVMTSLGQTFHGRDIWALKITDQPDIAERGEPSILINGLHHARELMTTEVVLDMAETLLSGYANDPQMRAWVDQSEIWLVPMVNPDGAVKVWTENAEWRKNNAEPHGVDLNRNYPYQWGACRGSSRAVDSVIYRGPSPGSEKEVQAIMALVDAVQPVINVSYHSYDEAVYYPMGCDGQKAEDPVVADLAGRLAGKLVKDDDSGSYKSGTPWELMYAMDGNDLDWMYATHHVIPFMVEMNAAAQGFLPDYEEWRDVTVGKMRPGWQYLLQELTDGPQIRIALGPQAVPLTKISWQKSGSPQNRSFEKILRPDGSVVILVQPGTYTVTIDHQTNGKVQHTVVVKDGPVYL